VNVIDLLYFSIRSGYPVSEPDSNAGADAEGFLRGDMASAGARAYSGGLGAEPPAGSRGRAPDQGVGGKLKAF